MLPDTIALVAPSGPDYTFSRAKHAMGGQRAKWQKPNAVLTLSLDSIEVAQEVTKAGRTNTLLSVSAPGVSLDPNTHTDILNPNGPVTAQLKVSVPKGEADLDVVEYVLGLVIAYLSEQSLGADTTALARRGAWMRGEH